MEQLHLTRGTLMTLDLPPAKHRRASHRVDRVVDIGQTQVVIFFCGHRGYREDYRIAERVDGDRLCLRCSERFDDFGEDC